MPHLTEIHSIALAEIGKRFSLSPVSLKYPFPERPVRLLGLVKIEGDVFCSEKFSRVVIMRTEIPFVRSVRSIFLSPHVEFDLPVFSSETIIAGRKRMFLVDIHRRGQDNRHDDSELFERLIKIRDRYPSLLENKTSLHGKIQNIFSPAVCQVNINESHDNEAIKLFLEYLGVFLDMVDKASPLFGEQLEQATKNFENYLSTVVEHDPGVKVYSMLFGKTGGVTRALDIFFGR